MLQASLETAVRYSVSARPSASPRSTIRACAGSWSTPRLTEAARLPLPRGAPDRQAGDAAAGRPRQEVRDRNGGRRIADCIQAMGATGSC
jgi:hypothetical protein